MNLSNNQIRKLGDRLRKSGCIKDSCVEDDLIMLQEYRLSHKEALIDVFDILSIIGKTIHKNRIVSFRVKKIDTILSKLNRLPSMDLDRMWDIAGCRCIVHSESAVYKIWDKIEQKLDIVRVKDSIETPDSDGYRAVHLNVRKKGNASGKVVEIQLRTLEQHYWSTLVEIVDVLFETKIKEGDTSVPELNKFLEIYSRKNEVTIEERLQALKIEQEYKIYKKISSTFGENIISLRKEWLKRSAIKSKDVYLVFEVDQETKESIFSVFNTFDEAENYYFDRFLTDSKDLLVSHLDVNRFTQLSVAYANYILTNHDFQESWIDFSIETLEHLIESKKNYDVRDIIDQLHINVEEMTLFNEDSVKKTIETNKVHNLNSSLKILEWLMELNESSDQRYQKMNYLKKSLEKALSNKDRSLLKRILDKFK